MRDLQAKVLAVMLPERLYTTQQIATRAELTANQAINGLNGAYAKRQIERDLSQSREHPCLWWLS